MGDAASELMDNLQAQSAVRRMVEGGGGEEDRRGDGGGAAAVEAINGDGRP